MQDALKTCENFPVVVVVVMVAVVVVEVLVEVVVEEEEGGGDLQLSVHTRHILSLMVYGMAIGFSTTSAGAPIAFHTHRK